MRGTVRHRSRPGLLRALASAALLASLLGCGSEHVGTPVAAASTPPSGSLRAVPTPVPTTPGSTMRTTLPPVGGRFDYQLGGSYPPPAATQVVARDRSSAPAPHTYGICYVNAFQTQPDELTWWKVKHPRVLLMNAGTYVEDPDWPGEVLLDTSTAAKRAELATVVGAWVDGCAAKGFKGVEFDNLDSWTRSGGRLSSSSAVAFVKLLVARAHARRLAVAQKNAAELAPQGKAIGFDFAVAEECQVYSECDAYTAVYGRHVLEIEYTDNGLDSFPQACAARGRQISVVLRDRDLVPAGQDGYVYRPC